jgi:hypothetical protein
VTGRAATAARTMSRESLEGRARTLRRGLFCGETARETGKHPLPPMRGTVHHPDECRTHTDNDAGDRR